MSRRSRNSDSFSSSSGGREFVLECKAAFLSMYDDIDDKIESKKRLNAVLQQTGRNPGKKALDKYWTYETDSLSFTDFVDICRKEPVTTADDLLKAFRKIDINGDGYISLDELYKIMNGQGETMTREEVRRMIAEVDENDDGRLDYGEFTNMIMKTTEESKKFSLKVMEKKEKKKKRIQDRIQNGDDKTRSRRESGGSLHSQQDQNTSRSVAEEIEAVEDDDDVIVSSRPTPRIDLKETRSNKGTPASSKADLKEDILTDRKGSMSHKDRKGNKSDTKELANNALEGDVTIDNKKTNVEEMKVDKETVESGAGQEKADSEHERTKAENRQKDKEKKNKDQKMKAEKSDPEKVDSDDEVVEISKRRFNRSQIKKESKDNSAKESDTAKSKTSGKADKSNFIDELFKSSTRSRSLYLASFSDDFKADNTNGDSDAKKAEKKGAMDKPNGTKTNEKEKDGKKFLTTRQLSDLAPVPSPRKSVSSRLEDDMPKPSPRIIRREKKVSSKSSGKMMDADSLTEWQHYTSKGCFFYEDNEIVTHVYQLKVTATSTVYLTACPINEPACLNLPETEPVDTALYIFDDRGKLIECTEEKDVKGVYGVRCELEAGVYRVLPYTTGCRFKQRKEDAQANMKEAKLIKTVNDKVVITSKFRQALEDIFDLCDLDDNGTMSKDEFNWFNLRTSGEELGEDEWEVVEERTELKDGEITKEGFIALNEMEAEDANGDVEDLWITLTSMGMNKGLMMDEASPYRVDVYVEEQSRKRPSLKVTGIESLETGDFVGEICKYLMDKAEDQVRIKNMKDLYMYTYKTDNRATIVIDNRSRSDVSLEVDCRRSKNVISNRPNLDYTLEMDPQQTAIAHHLLPKSELQDWSVSCTETIHK